MNNRWEAFLDGLREPGNRVSPAMDRVAPDNKASVLVNLSPLKLILVSGEDAEKFLQGQITNDIRNVSENRFQIAGHCTPKGRMLANFVVFRRQQSYLLQMPADTHQMLLKRLPMYILMSKVKIEDASDELCRFGFAGDSAPERLREQLDSIPGDPWESVQTGGISLLRHPGTVPRFELVGEYGPMTDLWRELSAKAIPGDLGYWSLLDIRAGIGVIVGATSEAFVPQMTNMHLLNGISFTKGCYTGQEVVARMKYLGKLKRRMYLARVDSNTTPKPGDEVYAKGSQSGQGAGKIVDAQPSPEGGYELLSVLEIASFESDDVHLCDSNGPRLMFQQLPYSFEQE